jgi:HEXXH motif-containing protein
VARALLLNAAAAAAGPVDTILADPFVGAWAARCVDHPVDRSVVATLEGLAAVASMRAGVTTSIDVSTRGGRLVLPTLGVLTVPNATDRVTLAVEAGRCVADLGSERVVLDPARTGRPGVWRARRHLHTPAGGHSHTPAGGQSLNLIVEDQEPERDCFGLDLAPPLSERDLAHWSTLAAEAWRLLVRYQPTVAPVLRDACRAVVPLASSTGAPGLSATSRDAYGAFAATTPADAVGLAVTLLHERQHALCNAVLDLVALTEPGGQARYFAPWRQDARPIDGFLHGTFAFVGVAEGWAAFRADPMLRRRADNALAEVREQVGVAVAQLRAAGELTRAGRLFVDGLEERLVRLLAITLPAAAVHNARRRTAARLAEWRHDHPDLAPLPSP